MNCDEIHAATIAACLPYSGLPCEGKLPQLPAVSLLEMLQAMAWARRLNAKQRSGPRTMRVIADDRLIAGVYAIQQWGGLQGMIEYFQTPE